MNAETLQYIRTTIGHAIVQEIEFLGETTLEVRKENLIEVLAALKQTPTPGFEVLMDLTGVDYLEPVKRTKVVYWLHNPTNLSRIRVVLYANRDEAIPSVTQLWEGADWYERELYDLFGVRLEGHPDMKRILMPDDWIGHPLRRDYPLTEEPVEFKYGVKPKVPSEIIPRDKNIAQFNLFGTYAESDQRPK
jgi:NADH-quinone oxidoreductase subunit C